MLRDDFKDRDELAGGLKHILRKIRQHLSPIKEILLECKNNFHDVNNRNADCKRFLLELADQCGKILNKVEEFKYRKTSNRGAGSIRGAGSNRGAGIWVNSGIEAQGSNRGAGGASKLMLS